MYVDEPDLSGSGDWDGKRLETFTFSCTWVLVCGPGMAVSCGLLLPGGEIDLSLNHIFQLLTLCVMLVLPDVPGCTSAAWQYGDEKYQVFSGKSPSVTQCILLMNIFSAWQQISFLSFSFGKRGLIIMVK